MACAQAAACLALVARVRTLQAPETGPACGPEAMAHQLQCHTLTTGTLAPRSHSPAATISLSRSIASAHAVGHQSCRPSSAGPPNTALRCEDIHPGLARELPTQSGAASRYLKELVERVA